MGLLQGKTALITGAARGIGKAIALKFAEEGANIAFTDLIIDENGLATEAEIASKGVKAKGYASNAADFTQTEEVVKLVKEEFGTIDILVNNAGITKDGLMLRMSEQQWDAVINVNLKSAFNFIHACVPIMMRQRGGSIINMASMVGEKGSKGQLSYAATKGAVIAATKSAAKELAENHIRVNAIAPGMVGSERFKAVLEEKFAQKINDVPFGRLANPEEVASLCLFLASDQSSYITGQIIGIDGGAII